MKKIVILGVLLCILLVCGCVGKMEKPAAPAGTAPKYHTEYDPEGKLDWYRANHGAITTDTVKTATAVGTYFEPIVPRKSIDVCETCHEIDTYCNECHKYVGAKLQAPSE